MAALGEGWEELIDESTGSTYYWNRETQESRWASPGWGEPLAEGSEWTLVRGDGGAADYYHNARTDETTWERPSLGGGASAAAGATASSPSPPSRRLSVAGGAVVVDPLMWIEHTDGASGRRCFFNAASRTRRSKPPLPHEGCVWERHVDATTGAAYFCDRVSGGTIWVDELKRELRAPAEANEQRGSVAAKRGEEDDGGLDEKVAKSEKATPLNRMARLRAMREKKAAAAAAETKRAPRGSAAAKSNANDAVAAPAAKASPAPTSRLARMRALRAKKAALGIDPVAAREKRLREEREAELAALRSVRATIRDAVHEHDAADGAASGAEAPRFARDIVEWNPRADMDMPAFSECVGAVTQQHQGEQNDVRSFVGILNSSPLT